MLSPFAQACSGDRDDPLAVSAAQAARMLGIGARSLWSLTKSREIPHVRIGRRVIYPVAELRAWLAKRADSKSVGNDPSTLVVNTGRVLAARKE